MRFGLDVPVSGEFADVELLSRIAVEAERVGWDGVFLQDTFDPNTPAVDPWLALAVLATRTTSVRLGVMVTPLSRRRPWVVSRQAATIDGLSGGRMTVGFGLGAGERDFTPFGEDWDLSTRASMLDEGLTIVNGLWSGTPFTFTGQHYQLQGARLLPRPIQTPRIPVWLAGGWPRRAPIARAARWDGAYLMTYHQATGEFLSPADVADAAEDLRLEGAKDGFDLAFNPPPDSGPESVASYERAGATWWMDFAESDDPGTFLSKLRAGPPRSSH